MNKVTNHAQEVRKTISLWVFLNDSSFFLFLAVAAEYLAKGYVLSDRILERAIEIDSESSVFDLFPVVILLTR